MSLSNTAAKVGPYTLTTLPQTLAVTFPFQQAADLLVYNLGTASTPIVPAQLLTLNSDYTVTGGGYDGSNNMQTGSISAVAGGANSLVVGDNIVIIRSPAQNQLTSFLNTGILTVAMIEAALDKCTTLSQLMQTQINNCLRIPTSDPASAVVAMLSSVRASKVLGFDANGNLAFLPAADQTAAAASAAAAAASAALAQAAAGVALIGLSGNVAGKLDYLVTAGSSGVPINSIRDVLTGTAGTDLGVTRWALQSGTFATDGVSYQRPADYNGSTNTKVWVSVG